MHLVGFIIRMLQVIIFIIFLSKQYLVFECINVISCEIHKNVYDLFS